MNTFHLKDTLNGSGVYLFCPTLKPSVGGQSITCAGDTTITGCSQIMSLSRYCTKCLQNMNLVIYWSSNLPTFSCVNSSGNCLQSQYKPNGTDCIPCNQGPNGKAGC
jgi:hypothetical protein